MLDFVIVGLIIGVLLIVGLATAVILLKKKGKKAEEPDYQALFMMGISFTVLGLVLVTLIDNPGFLGIFSLGIIYMGLGLQIRDYGHQTQNEAPCRTADGSTLQGTVHFRNQHQYNKEVLQTLQGKSVRYKDSHKYSLSMNSIVGIMLILF